MSLPSNITPVAISAAGWTGPDGTGFNGLVIFAASSLLLDPTGSAVIDGTASGTLTAGVMPAVELVPTDCPEVSPSPFTYTITIRLQTPDGSSDDQVFTGVEIPGALGSADLSHVIP